MTKFLTIFLLFIFITNCSLDTKSNIWTEEKKLVEEKQNPIKLLFQEEKALKNEFNSGLKIKLSGKLIFTHQP